MEKTKMKSKKTSLKSDTKHPDKIISKKKKDITISKKTKEKSNKKHEFINYFTKSNLKNTIEFAFDKTVSSELPEEINRFNLIKKRTYCNKMDLIIDYNNRLLNGYSRIDDFIMTYLNTKWRIDKKDYTINKKEIDPKTKEEKVVIDMVETEKNFLEDLYNQLFTPRFVRYIEKWVDENYHLNIDENNKEKAKKFNPVLQFSDRHCKMLQSISLGMKISIPLILHFAGMYSIINVNNYLERAFDYLFDLFSHDVDLHSKLWESVYSRVVVTKNSDKTFWNYVEIEGNSINKLTAGIYQKLIVDIIPKYEIDQNLINLNHVFINNNIDFTFMSDIQINYKPLNLAESSDEVSDYDKISINTARIDEGIIIINEVNIEMTINKLIKKYNLNISKKELEYYFDNLKKNELQEHILCNYFGKDLGNADCIYFCDRKQYITLLIILKHILMNNGFTILPEIIVGNINNINEKSTLGKKVLVDIITDKEFEDLQSNKYNFTENNTKDPDKQSMIIRLAANILNNKFMYGSYENKDKTEEEIEISNKNILKKEILDFTDLI